MRISRRDLLVAVACSLWAQEAKFSTGVDLVTLLATVRDAQGLLAKNLGRDDFVLLEDGVPQTIRYFSRESYLPLTIGLLVDTSNSQLHVIEPERRASYTFLDQVIREDQDQAFVAISTFACKCCKVLPRRGRISRRRSANWGSPAVLARCFTTQSGIVRRTR